MPWNTVPSVCNVAASPLFSLPKITSHLPGADSKLLSSESSSPCTNDPTGPPACVSAISARTSPFVIMSLNTHEASCRTIAWESESNTIGAVFAICASTSAATRAGSISHFPKSNGLADMIRRSKVPIISGRTAAASVAAFFSAGPALLPSCCAATSTDPADLAISSSPSDVIFAGPFMAARIPESCCHFCAISPPTSFTLSFSVSSASSFSASVSACVARAAAGNPDPAMIPSAALPPMLAFASSNISADARCVSSATPSSVCLSAKLSRSL